MKDEERQSFHHTSSSVSSSSLKSLPPVLTHNPFLPQPQPDSADKLLIDSCTTINSEKLFKLISSEMQTQF
jgi:hypothetical protein